MLLKHVVSDLEGRIRDLDQKLLLADQTRSTSLAERDWWMQARQYLSLELQV